ncbi:NYN domain-containing protein [Ekhidna sp. MALMAid0563]|uniref:NYN domain-containing protein n=1 Tax=Ekhidna sp. MALMAid0563 TaxID=3143937 RepID=UPI0032DF59E4
MKTAILIDGGFFLKRYHCIRGFERQDSPELVAKNLVSYCFKHIYRVNQYRKRYDLPPTELYRIYYYDSKPFDGDSRGPISKRAISFKNTDQYKFRNKLFEALKQQRKIALRLGFLKNSSKEWSIRSKYTKKLLSGQIKISELKQDDLEYPLQQKAVDMKLGLDIATLAFKDLVSQIILIAGDSDFVPAAKFARREGVDFILDPMLNPIDPTLHEHIDGKMTIKNMAKQEDNASQ